MVARTALLIVPSLKELHENEQLFFVGRMIFSPLKTKSHGVIFLWKVTKP